ncbi:MAG: phosphatidylglycerophosphatase A [Syntrophorhabdus sp.]
MVKRRPIDAVLSFFNTCFFTGYIPFAPGTFASALAAIVIYFLHLSNAGGIILAFASSIFGIISVNWERYDGEDPCHIVIDEFAGMSITMAGHEATLTNVIIGFALFRILDIAKPFPIRKFERLPGGYGIMADDIVAGICANILIFIVTRFI